MRILVIGQGGREHVLAWKISQSSKVDELYCAPGNAGMESFSQCVPIPADDIDQLLVFAKEKKIDLTMVGPEAPLVAGIVDRFRLEGLKVFGPDRYASQLEGSKVFSKNLMKTLKIPTAAFHEFSDVNKALAYLSETSFPLVIKADGLAAGKGVTVAATREEAEEAVQRAMRDKVFGAAGERIVIEECLKGEEASLIAISDGETLVNLASSQDHKRIFEGDQGPNTGGMGAYSPAPIVTEKIEKEARERVFLPVIREFKKLGHPFIGFLYAGIMITKEGIQVLEFNVRFGDPEAQVVLPRLQTDFVALVEACLEKKLDSLELEWKKESSVTVVLASEGYPGVYRKGDKIQGLLEAEQSPRAMVFHAGTRKEGSSVVTHGGRVLSVVASGGNIKEAVTNVYEAVQKNSVQRNAVPQRHCASSIKKGSDSPIIMRYKG